MARPRELTPTPPTGFLASAVRLPTATRNSAGRNEGWQGEAWSFWESVGELRAVSVWIGNVMSRARLMAGERQGTQIVPVEDGPAAEAMHDLYGGPQGQAQMLQAFGTHLTVAGEGFLTHLDKDDAWYVLATGKVTQVGRGPNAKLLVDTGSEAGMVEMGKNDLTVRLWTPNPRDPTRADSPVRACLSTLAQIIGYDQHIAAQIQSRLAGQGILFISSEVEFATPPGGDPAMSPADTFMAVLGESMETAKQNPGTASAAVPIVAMVPTEALGKNEHMKFWTDLDAAVVEMRDAAIKRLALGLDVPPEVLLGIGDANHWNAWLSEESAVKAHLEPRLSTISAGLTTGYLRPAIEGLVPNADDWYVIADTASIRLRPNRSQEAIELHDRGELSGEALRRETGFLPEDAPTPQELIQYLLKKVAVGSSTPEQSALALKALGIDLGPVNDARPQGPPDHMRTDTVPALPEHAPPNMDESRPIYTEGLAAAANVLVYRALERAGNRLKNTHPRTMTGEMAPAEIYRHLTGEPDQMLAGAWQCADDVLTPYTDDVRGVVETLDFYVRGLLTSHRPHSAVVLQALLASRPPALTEVT